MLTFFPCDNKFQAQRLVFTAGINVGAGSPWSVRAKGLLLDQRDRKNCTELVRELEPNGEVFPELTLWLDRELELNGNVFSVHTSRIVYRSMLAYTQAQDYESTSLLDSTFLILPATTIFEISIIVSVRSDLTVVSHCQLYSSGISKAGAVCRPSVVSPDKLQLAFCRIFRRWASNVAFEYHELKFKLPILYHYAKG
jgi:hypothetical protein